MAHFAQLDKNNVVLQIIVVNNDVVDNLTFPASEALGISFCQSLYGADTIWKQTSYNNNFRKVYAGIGSIYDFVLDEFVISYANSHQISNLASTQIPALSSTQLATLTSTQISGL